MAAVLGMSRRATRSRFDDIVAFADIGRYIDTPVKRYSSGMLARLGFAVAAHLDAEIIVIDEVLSVGDAAFQRKCHERIRRLRSDGAAVLFVTHNTWVVPLVCDRAMLLVGGQVVAAGDPVSVLARYQTHGSSVRTLLSEAGMGAIEEVTLSPSTIGPGDPLSVDITLTIREPMPDGHLLLGITGTDGALVEAGLSSHAAEVRLDRAGRNRIRCSLAAVPLQPGPYFVYVSVVGQSGAAVVEDQHRVALEVTGDPRDRPTYGVVALVPGDLSHQASALSRGQQAPPRRPGRQSRPHRPSNLGADAAQVGEGGNGDQAQREERDDDEQQRAGHHGEDLDATATAPGGIHEHRPGPGAVRMGSRVRGGH